MKVIGSYIRTIAENNDTFTLNDALRYVRQRVPHASASTVIWNLHYLTNKGELQRIRRGLYAKTNHKKKFSLIPDQSLLEKAKLIDQKLPYTRYCVWNVAILQDYARHQFIATYDILEVEKEALDAAAEILADIGPWSVQEKNLQSLPSALAAKRGTVVKRLLHEAPLEIRDGVWFPKLEKIVVDLLCDSPGLAFIQGTEAMTIIANLLNIHAFNWSTASRYASRRGKKKEIEDIYSNYRQNDQ